MVWNVDPILLSLGPLQIRWYGLMFVSGFFLGLKGMQWVFRKEGLNPDKLDGLLTYLFIGTLVGARLGHCLLYEPAYFLANPLEIFAVWHGGLASHGGVLGVIASLILFTRRNPEFPLMWLVDRITIFTAMTGGFIRLGNLMNSEILGKPTTSAFGVIFARVDQIPRHPAQVYESLSYFLLAIALFTIYRSSKHKPPRGLIFGISLVVVFTVRFFLEFLKENQEAFEQSMVLNMGQLLSIPFVIVGFVFIYRALRSPATDTPVEAPVAPVRKRSRK